MGTRDSRQGTSADSAEEQTTSWRESEWPLSEIWRPLDCKAKISKKASQWQRIYNLFPGLLKGKRKCQYYRANILSDAFREGLS